MVPLYPLRMSATWSTMRGFVDIQGGMADFRTFNDGFGGIIIDLLLRGITIEDSIERKACLALTLRAPWEGANTWRSSTWGQHRLSERVEYDVRGKLSIPQW